MENREHCGSSGRRNRAMFSAKTMLDRGGETDIKQASKNGIMKTAEPRFNSGKTVTAPKVDLFYSLKRGAEHAGIRRAVAVAQSVR